MKKETKGITLIALVITIIVLLILAGISIMMLTGNNSILNRATDAKEKTIVGSEKEAISVAYNGVLANTQGAGVKAEDLQRELRDNGNKKATAVSKDNKIEVTFETGHVYIVGENGRVTEFTPVDRTGINVGDYIDYEPTEGTYPASKLTEEYTGNTRSSYNKNDLTTKVTTDGTTTKTVANWRVLRIYEDGSMDIIGDPTTYTLSFQNARGYNNGPKVMNDICAALYSNSTHGITARSVDINDFEVEGRGSWASAKADYISNEISSLKTKYDNNTSRMQSYAQGVDTTNNTVTWQTERSYYPNIYASEKGAGINTTTVNDTENKETLRNNLDTSSNAQYAQASTSGLTTEYTNYKLDINSENYGDAYKALSASHFYWLASRNVSIFYYTASFNLYYAINRINTRNMLYAQGNSMGDDADGSFSLRPIVSLKSDISITKCTGDNSADNMHTINW